MKTPQVEWRVYAITKKQEREEGKQRWECVGGLVGRD
jgi:hypothetical protein